MGRGWGARLGYPMSVYDDWIAANVPKEFTGVYGKCADFTKRMKEQFPELEIQGGFYLCYGWGERQHWWLRAPDGSVVDPTAHQFPSNGAGEYRHLEPDQRPIGKCMNCGELTYEGAPAMEVCSDRCHQELQRYYNTPLGLGR